MEESEKEDAEREVQGLEPPPPSVQYARRAQAVLSLRSILFDVSGIAMRYSTVPSSTISFLSTHLSFSLSFFSSSWFVGKLAIHFVTTPLLTCCRCLQVSAGTGLTTSNLTRLIWNDWKANWRSLWIPTTTSSFSSASVWPGAIRTVFGRTTWLWRGIGYDITLGLVTLSRLFVKLLD